MATGILGRAQLYKCVEAEFADAFIDSGVVRVGTLLDYRKMYEHDPELGDRYESALLHRTELNKLIYSSDDLPPPLRSRIKKSGGGPTAFVNCEFTEVKGYGDAFVFCMTEGPPSAEVVKQMGKGAVFHLVNVKGFCDALTAALHARHPVDQRRVLIGRCVYESRRTDEPFPRKRGTHPAFVKEPEYAYQREVRICWIPPTAPIKPELVRCGPLHAYWRRVL